MFGCQFLTITGHLLTHQLAISNFHFSVRDDNIEIHTKLIYVYTYAVQLKHFASFSATKLFRYEKLWNEKLCQHEYFAAYLKIR